MSNEQASPWRGPSSSIINDGSSKAINANTAPWGGHIIALPILLVLLTVADIVLCAIALDRFTETYAQYFNQGTAFVYCIASSLILLCRRGEGRAEEAEASDSDARRAPWYLLVLIGLFNGSSNWCLAVAQPHTAGLTQSLLSQGLGVPLVMLLSFVFLRRRPSSVAILGASLILAGTVISATRANWHWLLLVENSATSDSGGVVTFWYSVALFAFGQCLLAVEKVIEDSVFGRFERQDAMVMFCVTMWVQFFLYIPLLPTQILPELGGLHLSEIPLVAWDGVLCTFGITATSPSRLDPSLHPGLQNPLPKCDVSNTLLFFIYCTVDMSCYFTGLYAIKRCGANMMVIASSMALPLQQIVFCASFLVTKQYAANFYATDLLALMLVCVGYYVYQWLSVEGSQGRNGVEDEDVVGGSEAKRDLQCHGHGGYEPLLA